MNLRFIIIVCLLVMTNIGQAKKVDSLLVALKNVTIDSTRCSIFLQLGELVYKRNQDSALLLWTNALNIAEKRYADHGISGAEKKTYAKYLSRALNSVAFVIEQKGEIIKALEYYERNLRIEEKNSDSSGMSNTLHSIAFIYNNQGNVGKALEYFSKSLKLYESLGDKHGAATSLNTVGLMYYHQGAIDKAMEYYHKSLKIREEIGDKQGIATSLNNIGAAYRKLNNIPKAMENYEKSMKIREEISDKSGIAALLNNFGFIYSNNGELLKALDYYYRSLKIREDMGDKKGIATSLNNLGSVYFKLYSTQTGNKQSNLNKALKYSSRSLEISTELGFPENIYKAAKSLNSVYKAKGDYNNALKYFELYILMRDSIQNEETKKASIKSQLSYEFEKKAAADSIKNAELQKVQTAQLIAQEAKLKQERTQFRVLVGGLIFIAAGLFVVINRFRVTNKQKKIIELQKSKVDEAYDKLSEKNKEVLDSIQYAKRIQSALLTSQSYIRRKLKELNAEK